MYLMYHRRANIEKNYYDDYEIKIKEMTGKSKMLINKICK